MREKIGNASGEELKRAAFELGRIGEKAGMKKTITEHAIRNLKQRQAIPPSERMP